MAYSDTERASALPASARLVLTQNDRAFDAKIVRSALDFLGRFLAPTKSEAEAAVEAVAPFEWVPYIVRLRARVGGVSSKRWNLSPPKPRKWMPAMDQGSLRLSARTDDDTVAKRCNTLATIFLIALADIQTPNQGPLLSGRYAHADDEPRRNSKERWLRKQLRGIQIIEQPTYRNAEWGSTKTPLLRNVEACLSYALYVLQKDEWGFSARVEKCPYRKSDRPPRLTRGVVWSSRDSVSEPIAARDSGYPGRFEPDHWFLDVDEDGKVPPGPPRKFCNDQHASADRQRRLRRRQSAAKHK